MTSLETVWAFFFSAQSCFPLCSYTFPLRYYTSSPSHWIQHAAACNCTSASSRRCHHWQWISSSRGWRQSLPPPGGCLHALPVPIRGSCPARPQPQGTSQEPLCDQIPLSFLKMGSSSDVYCSPPVLQSPFHLLAVSVTLSDTLICALSCSTAAALASWLVLYCCCHCSLLSACIIHTPA